MPSAFRSRRADARQQQQLRRIDRAAAQNDLPVDALFGGHAVQQIAHAHGALAIDQHFGGQRPVSTSDWDD